MKYDRGFSNYKRPFSPVVGQRDCNPKVKKFVRFFKSIIQSHRNCKWLSNDWRSPPALSLSHTHASQQPMKTVLPSVSTMPWPWQPFYPLWRVVNSHLINWSPFTVITSQFTPELSVQEKQVMEEPHVCPSVSAEVSRSLSDPNWTHSMLLCKHVAYCRHANLNTVVSEPKVGWTLLLTCRSLHYSLLHKRPII